MDGAELAALFEESLVVWHLDGRVTSEGDGLVISARGLTVRIGMPPEGAPFRWMVTTGEKARGVASLSALLRVVRNALDPQHAGSRLRLAPRGVLPP